MQISDFRFQIPDPKVLSGDGRKEPKTLIGHALVGPRDEGVLEDLGQRRGPLDRLVFTPCARTWVPACSWQSTVEWGQHEPWAGATEGPSRGPAVAFNYS